MSEQAIREVIERAYIEGIHLEQDEEKVRRGFHPEFRMLVRRGEEVLPVDSGTFLARVIDRRREDPAAFESELSYEIEVLDRAETAAVARIDLSRSGVHQFTDYMLLYRFADGWKIVSKAFHAYPRD